MKEATVWDEASENGQKFQKNKDYLRNWDDLSPLRDLFAFCRAVVEHVPIFRHAGHSRRPQRFHARVPGSPFGRVRWRFLFALENRKF
jgi:hypothetical protein